MKLIKMCLFLGFIGLILTQIVCITQYPMTKKPDMERFDSTVVSTVLRDSLKVGKLTPGMPYFVVDQIFQDWTPRIKKTKNPVASLGSKQRLEEVEGWGRKYVDPNWQVFLDQYKRDKQILTVWYQMADFYQMDVSAGDTLVVFSGDTIFSSLIECLKNSRVLKIEEIFSEIPRNTNLYAEIHYYDHPWREISYWYAMRILSDGQTFMLKVQNYENYPIELLELDGESVSSYQWR